MGQGKKEEGKGILKREKEWKGEMETQAFVNEKGKS